MVRKHSTSVPYFSRGTGAVCTILAVLLLMLSVDTAQAATIEDSLGNTSPGFDDGATPSIIQLSDAQSGQPAPFDAAKGSDPDGPDFSATWTHDYGAIADTVISGSITLGVAAHDSAQSGNQVLLFTLDGNDLTSLLNARFEEQGGGESEYNVYTAQLPGSTFDALADGSATLALDLQGPGAAGASNNGAHLIFSTLSVESGPSTFTLTVDGDGDGSGSVSVTAINCTINAGITSGTCTDTVDTGSKVMLLTAEADPGSVFDGWTNCDAPADNHCTMTIDSDKTVTATFNQSTAQPVANAGPDQTVPVGATVILDGSGSTGAGTYAWTLTTVPELSNATASLTGAATASPSFVADLAGTYVAELLVNDGTEDSAPDSVTITAGTTELVGFWSFEEGAGTTANDASGNGNTGTLENGTAWVAGKVGNSAVGFDGTDDQVRIADSDSLDFGIGQDFSFSFWFRDSTPGLDETGAAELVEKQGDTGGFYQIRSPNATGALRVQVSDGTNQDFFNTNSGNLADGAWHHAVVIRDYDTGISAYIDGALAGSNNIVTAESLANDADLLFGGASTALGFYDGELDQVRIYRRVLSETEIAELFAEVPSVIPPVANAGEDQHVGVGATVTLDGSGSTGAETYAWTLTTVPELSNATASLTGADTSNPSFVADLAGTYVAELVVNDGSEDSAPDSVTITAGEILLLANAGEDQHVGVGATVTLDGSGSAGAETYAWTLTTVPELSNATASLTGADTANPSFVADLAGTYVAELVVNDGTEDSAPDSVSITAHETLQADPSFTLFEHPSDRATGFKVDITRVFDPITGEEVSVSLGSIEAQLTYPDPSSNPSLPSSSLCVNILDVREMAIPITGRTIDNQAGAAAFDGSLPSGVTAPTDVGHALTRLTGSADQQCQLRSELTSLSDVDSNPIAAPTPLTQTVQRGDARADGDVTIADALFIAQNLMGSRSACAAAVDTSCLHSVNAASVQHDGEFDKQDIVDALYIAEYLLGLRDEFYNLVP